MNKLECIRNGDKLYSIEVPYSTKEHIIGTWIDGKPLYRIVIQDTMPETETDGSKVEKHINIANNISERFIEFAYITDNSYNNVPMPYITLLGYHAKCYISGSKKLILINACKTYNNRPCTVSVLYTKTTD